MVALVVNLDGQLVARMVLKRVGQVLLDFLHHHVVVDARQVAAAIPPSQVMDLLLVLPDQVLPLVLVQEIVLISFKLVLPFSPGTIAMEFLARCTDLIRV